MTLATYQAARCAEQLRDSITKALVAGVSTRDIATTQKEETPGLSKSNVSRHWQTVGHKILTSHHLGDKGSLEKYLRRPEISWDDLVELHSELDQFSADVAEQIMFDVKYAGYVSRQQGVIERQQRLAQERIPEDFDYDSLTHLRNEAREKFNRFRPVSLEQASRISGITPADVALIMLHLR